MTENPDSPEPGDAAHGDAPVDVPSVVLATLGKRVASHVIDAGIPIGMYVVSQLLLFKWLWSGDPDSPLLWLVWLIAIGIGALGIYQWRGIAKTGQSIGKRVMGIWVLDADTGQPIGWARALLRWTVLCLLGAFWIPLLILLLTIPNDPRRQGWHDKAANTVVVMAADGTTDSPVQAAPSPEAIGSDLGSAPLAVVEPTPSHAAPPPADDMPSLATGLPTAPPPAPAPTPAASPPNDLSRPSEPSPVPSVKVPQVAPPPPLPDVAPPPGPQVPPPPGPVGDAPQAVDAPAAIVSPPADHTVLSDRLRAEPPRVGWRLVADDGTEIEVMTSVIVGRDPSGALVPGAVVAAVADPHRTMSKTHAALRLVEGELTVEDLHSTNGVYVIADDEERQVPAGIPHTLAAGQVVSFGDRAFSVERAG